MLKFVSCLAVLLLAGGCSWQNTLHAAAQAPGYVRLDERIWVENAPRWRLPATATVSVVNDGKAPQDWLSAAETGVAGVFRGPAGSTRSGARYSDGRSARYSLQVQWPEVSLPALVHAETSTSYRAGLLGFVTVPEIPAQQTLVIHVIDGHGQFLTSVNLHISPEIWGPTWQDMTRLRDSFTQLATVLRGG